MLVVIYLRAAVGVGRMLRQERRDPSSYTRSPEYLGALAAWQSMSTAEQEAVDEAAMDRAEQADMDARQDAAEAAEFLAHRARANALYHP